MEIRAEKTEDAGAIRKIHVAAFGQESEADLVEACAPSSAVDCEALRLPYP